MSQHQRAMLIILDGWGHGPIPEVSAIAQANTPFVDSLYKKYANAELVTFGLDVGLPEGQMGNSEVGHLNIGAGRVVYQELARINRAIETGELASHPELQMAIERANSKGGSIHLLGLLSDGGVHSHINHLKALCDILDDRSNQPVFIHAFTDGRDVDPQSGLGFVRDMVEYTQGKNSMVASVVGRYYAMDRDKRWERTALAYNLLVNGEGVKSNDLVASIQQSYDEGVTDEFVMPIAFAPEGEATGKIEDGDTVIFFNFRTDRPRQMVTVLTQADFPDHGMKTLDLDIVTMTEYDKTYKGVDILFRNENLVNTIGEHLSNLGKTQIRSAETEKYPHVTFFFSGGRETPFTGEDRILVASPKVPTYDLQPEMSAPEVTSRMIDAIDTVRPDFICLNFANTDMVGHTGVFDAAVKAAETVDTCLAQLVPKALEAGYGIIIIADHGNSDTMVNPDGSPHTAHTTNMVPVFFVSDAFEDAEISDGRLADVAPTLLWIMGIDPPEEMTGKILVTAR